MRKIARETLCLTLILCQLGCRSVYRFPCTSCPSEAGVVIAEEMMGETPCTVEIPRDSELIQDGKVEFTFCLPDGRERKETVDLHVLTPSNPLAETVAAPFLLVGGGAFVLALADDEDRDDEDTNSGDDGDKNVGDRVVGGAAGLGIAIIGAGLHSLLGGKAESLEGCEVHMDFNEPAEELGTQAPSIDGRCQRCRRYR